MDRAAAQAAYVRALLPEWEDELTRRARARVRPITRGMKPSEEAEYLAGKAFAATLWRVKRGDGVWQALQRGELVL